MKKYFIAGLVSVATFAFIITAVPSPASAAMLYRQLDIEMTGSDVSDLQTFLAQDSSVYPERLVTGYFGTLTKSAVARFQTKNDIPSVGRVGPITLSVINSQMSGGVVSGADVYGPIISNVSLNANASSATIAWSTNEGSRGMVYYNDVPLVMYEASHNVTASGLTISGDSSFRSSQNLNLTGLKANTTYYYMIHTIDSSGNVSVTWPSTFRTNN